MTTLCENEGTSNVVVRLKDIFVPFTFPQQAFKTNPMEVSNVQPKSWHATVAKLHNLPKQLIIDWANVIISVVVVHNEEKKNSWKGHW